jgi:POLQ-like helicase
MHEYNVPVEHHIRRPEGLDLEEQFPLAVGTIGDFAADSVGRRLGLSEDVEPTSPEDVQFAARVLQAFVDSRLNDGLTAELLLLLAAAFYLSGRAGDFMVLFKRLQDKKVDESNALAVAIRWVLEGPWNSQPPLDGSTPPGGVLQALALHLRNGYASVQEFVEGLRVWAYANGSAHELLLADTCSQST